MADNKKTIKEQIESLETQKKNIETMFIKIQGAIEALQSLEPLIDVKEKPEKKIKKK